MSIALNRPPTRRQSMVAAAARRGIPVGRIAINLGVRPSIVSEYLRRYELNTGTQIERRRAKPNRVASAKSLQFALCQHCLAPFRVPTQKRNRKKYRKYKIFCGNNCKVASQLKLTNPIVASIIESRIAGETWTGIARRQRATVMGVQGAVWKWLRNQGLLTRDTVRAIWRPSPSSHKRSFSTATVEKEFGPIPPEPTRSGEATTKSVADLLHSQSALTRQRGSQRCESPLPNPQERGQSQD